MYVKAKMIPVETVPGTRGERIKERVRGVKSSMIYLIHHKNICECHNVPPPSTAIKKKKERFSKVIISYDRKGTSVVTNMRVQEK
jgi:hypothetical protein